MGLRELGESGDARRRVKGLPEKADGLRASPLTRSGGTPCERAAEKAARGWKKNARAVEKVVRRSEGSLSRQKHGDVKKGRRPAQPHRRKSVKRSGREEASVQRPSTAEAEKSEKKGKFATGLAMSEEGGR